MKRITFLAVAIFFFLGCEKDLPTIEEPSKNAITNVEFNGRMIEVGESYPAGTFREFEEINGITSEVGGWYAGWPHDLGMNYWIVVYTFDECVGLCDDNQGMNLNGWQSGWTPINFAEPSQAFQEIPFDYSYSGVDLDDFSAVCDTINTYHKFQVTSENEDVRVQIYFFGAYLDKYDRPRWSIIDIDSHNVNMGDGDEFEFFAFSDNEPAGNQSFFGNECALSGATLIR